MLKRYEPERDGYSPVHGGMEEDCDGRYVELKDVIDAMRLWREFVNSKPSLEGVSDFLHKNVDRISTVIANVKSIER